MGAQLTSHETDLAEFNETLWGNVELWREITLTLRHTHTSLFMTLQWEEAEELALASWVVRHTALAAGTLPPLPGGRPTPIPKLSVSPEPEQRPVGIAQTGIEPVPRDQPRR